MASGYAKAIEHDVALARFLAEEVKRRSEFELLVEPVLSIVNFRHRRPGEAEGATLDARNRRIVNRLVGSGGFFLAPTLLKGRVSMRVAITNFRTREDDLVALLDEASRAGKELA